MDQRRAGQVTRYRLLYFDWVKIAAILVISVSALSQWRTWTGFVDPLKKITAAQLDAIIAPYMAQRASRGFTSVKSRVRSSGPVLVTDKEIWASMKRVGDPGMVVLNVLKLY